MSLVGVLNFPRILSIQSHVVSGYVGNKCAVFPLQLLGFEVDFINSVQFSNHTQYSHVKGQILDADQLDELFQGIVLNDLHKEYTHLLTGYIGSTSFLAQVANVIRELKKANSSLVYVCDPVMGDNGRMYVNPDLLPVYRETIVPLADIITPNQYEAELLSGVKITDEDSAVEAIDFFHGKGVKTVVLSSTEFTSDNEKLFAFGSQIHSTSSTKTRFRAEVTKLPSSFTGTGDLFTALVTAWSHHHPGDLRLVLEKTLTTMSSVLNRTLETSLGLAGSKAPTVAQLELKLVQSRRDIESPKDGFRVQKIS